jgi:hypothetical protein
MSTKTSATRTPRRRRGGQELPDAVQDRPEQNAGYDRAVRGGASGTPNDEAEVVDLEETMNRQGIRIEGEEGKEGEEG